MACRTSLLTADQGTTRIRRPGQCDIFHAAFAELRTPSCRHIVNGIEDTGGQPRAGETRNCFPGHVRVESLVDSRMTMPVAAQHGKVTGGDGGCRTMTFHGSGRTGWSCYRAGDATRSSLVHICIRLSRTRVPVVRCATWTPTLTTNGRHLAGWTTRSGRCGQRCARPRSGRTLPATSVPTSHAGANSSVLLSTCSRTSARNTTRPVSGRSPATRRNGCLRCSRRPSISPAAGFRGMLCWPARCPQVEAPGHLHPEHQARRECSRGHTSVIPPAIPTNDH